MVINRVRVLGSGPHTPTQFFWEYPPGVIATSWRKETKYTASTHGTELEEGNQEEKTPKDTMEVSDNFTSLQFSLKSLET